MGRKYTETIVICLTCLDTSNTFGDESEFLDENGILVGVRFIEKVTDRRIRGIFILLSLIGLDSTSWIEDMTGTATSNYISHYKGWQRSVFL